MSDIQFEQNDLTNFQRVERSVKGIPAFIIKTGIVKTEEQATLAMIGIIVVCVLFMGYKLVHVFKGPDTNSFDINTVDQTQFTNR
jgi:hypothetical protein